MKIVIDIPEEEYNLIIRECKTSKTELILLNAVCEGVVLPEHGRLIDADEVNLQRELFTFTRWTGIDEMPYENACTVLDNAETVLESYRSER